MMPIYTRRGDKGETSLASGERVRKDDPRVEAYGTVDELCAFLGAARAEVLSAGLSDEATRSFILDVLLYCQDLTMGLSAYLAKVGNSSVSMEDVKRLEEAIDKASSMLTPLQNFVLPGESRAEAFLHVARTVCRRCERRVAALAEERDGPAIPILNRLSDLLFVIARLCARAEGAKERLWNPRCRSTP